VIILKTLNKKTAKQIAKKQLKMRNKLTSKQYSRIKKVFLKLGRGVEETKEFISLLTYETFKKELIAVFKVSIKESVTETAKFLQTERGVNKKLIPVVRNKTLEQYSKQVVAEKVTNISDKTKKVINKIITKGQAEGKNIKAIAKDIEKSVKNMSKDRALRIARTETAQTSTVTYHNGLEAAGFDKTWWHVGGGKTDRESHLACDGETIKADEVFSCGLKHPHDPEADVGEIINCHCELV
jgi:phage protein F-like protein